MNLKGLVSIQYNDLYNGIATCIYSQVNTTLLYMFIHIVGTKKKIRGLLQVRRVLAERAVDEYFDVAVVVQGSRELCPRQ